MNYKDAEQIPGLLLFIYFEKALDSMEWSFIETNLSIIFWNLLNEMD